MYTLNALAASQIPDKHRVAFRLVNLMFAVLFGASAVLQYNDEAGLAWAALYFVGTCICLPETVGRYRGDAYLLYVFHQVLCVHLPFGQVLVSSCVFIDGTPSSLANILVSERFFRGEHQIFKL